MWKFFIYSLIGIICFFVPITINGKSTILIDHIVQWITYLVNPILPYYVLLLIIIGALHPFINKKWNKSKTDIIFSLFKVLGVFIAFMIVFDFGPGFVLKESIGPFLYDKLAIPLSVLIPVGAILLTFLVGYGLLEFIGVIMRPVMRPIFKTPGKSAVDAVASFVGSYSIGLLITNKVYKKGGYTHKEAVIVATGFSTVSATFMIIVANTLGIIEHWNLYFWFTLAVTFIVTAITVQLPPIRFEKNTTYQNQPYKEEKRRNMPLLKESWLEAKLAVKNADSLIGNVRENLRDGVVMTIAILPSIMSIGFLGLIIAEYTPIIEYVSYIFYPFISIFPVQDVAILAQASTISIVEMLLPAAIAQTADLATRFIVGVMSVSAIIFFSSVVPVILSTEIKISVGKLVLIWFERVVLTLLITIPFALWLF
ncbi:MAG: YjiH family protein [Staphylococcus equorum]|uniref:YjiH family protein n=1 Tax=Staphylococcus equorum TaxID=246432 RepID=A0AAW7AIS5_9STAP|nr:YjiH family protein [Staphylococcus equorum]MDG0836465.1 YjiH family protein [Staphylococcus equorum]MDK9865991.1 YjiH family protein [Staphylococcus equorum]MDK9872347.1 YjiH family protein [Staphylococcus equorum]MDK9878106.1 YjiH family protein [Staphylococcus equorum]MDN5828276.1 YjiH family protein [Staphylococcus equorum]